MDFEPFRTIVQQALLEDIGAGDITTEALIPPEEQARAFVIAREELTVAGLPLAEMVFAEVEPNLELQSLVEEGTTVSAGTRLLKIEGSARAILTAERTALNFLQHLSGIATLTARFVAGVGKKRVAVLDTRKTIPGLRKLQKYAVKVGGGENHRFGLYDAFLIKDNHLKILDRRGPGKIRRAIDLCRESVPGKAVEVEVENLEELEEALQAGADIVLLDNLSPEQLEEAVKAAEGKAELEASGGIILADIGRIAATGIDSVSLGCLTHSAPAVDISLEIDDDLPD